MLREKEIQALIALLDDNDSEVVHLVKNQLIDQGIAIHDILQEAILESNTDIELENLMEVIAEIQSRDLKSDFKRWMLTPSKSLLDGAYLIAKINFLDFDFDKYKTSLEKLKKEVWMEINQHQTPFEHVSIINQVLFVQNNFKVVDHLLESDLYALPYAIDSRKGNIYSIGLLYAILSELLHIPIYTVDLEDHLILAYCRDFIHNKRLLQEDVLFYINPEKNGAVFSKSEIDAYINKKQLFPLPKFFEPAPSNMIIRSMLTILSRFYSTKDPAKNKLAQEFIEIIDNYWMGYK